MNVKTAFQWTLIDLRDAAWHLLVNRIAGSYFTPRVVRYCLYRLARIDVRSPSLAAGIYLQSRRVTIGRGVFVNQGCRFYSSKARIVLGEKVQLGMNVTLVTDSHEMGPAEQRAGAVTSSSIRIGDGCWIGAGAMIMPGVEVGAGCVVAAGAVVTKDCQPNGLYAGVPAKRVRDLDDASEEVRRREADEFSANCP
jgi:maltose O-acetyltransferase